MEIITKRGRGGDNDHSKIKKVLVFVLLFFHHSMLKL